MTDENKKQKLQDLIQRYKHSAESIRIDLPKKSSRIDYSQLYFAHACCETKTSSSIQLFIGL